VSAVAGPENPATAGASWFLREAQITLPAGVSYIRPYFNRYGGSGGNYFIAEPAITRHQLGADITGANTAAAIAGQAATATNSNYTAITGTKPPADADKTSSNTSANTSNVGTVPASAVQSTINTGGGVATNQVNTASIVANAVTVPSVAYTPGTITFSSAVEVDMQTITIASGGGPISIFINLEVQGPFGSGGYILKVYRNGVLYQSFNYLASSAVFTVNTCILSDSQAAGTYTYKFAVIAGTTSTYTARSRFLQCLETKR